MTPLFVALVLVFFAVLVLRQVFIVVPEGSAYVVERLGAYHQTLHTGSHVLMPFIDVVAHRYTLATKTQELSDVAITHDNASVNVTSTYTWRITDPRKFAYNSADGEELVAGLIRSRQREWIAGKRLDDARSSTRELASAVQAASAEVARENGVEIVSVEVSRVG